MSRRSAFASKRTVTVSKATAGTLALLVGAAASFALAACIGGTSDDFLPSYGNATGLGGNNEPLSEDAAAETVSNATTADSSFTTVLGCTPGSTPNLYIQNKSCSVSWSKDIEGLMASPTGWDCTNSSCHGGSISPKITGSASDDYTTLVAYTGAFTKTYIDPCTNDPDKSAMACNVTDTMVSCDMQGSMPEITGAGNHAASAAEVAKLYTWLGCGAPNN